MLSRIQVAFLLPEFSLPIFKQSLLDTKNCAVSFLGYHHLQELPKLCLQLESEYDGFVIPYLSANRVFKKGCPKFSKPVVFITEDLTDLSPVLFEMLIKNRSSDLSRITAEAFYTTCRPEEQVDFMEQLYQIDPPTVPYEQMSLEQLCQIEDEFVHIVQKLWNNKRIDLVICSSGGTAQLLEQSSIPYQLIYPMPHQIQQALDFLVHKIMLRRTKDSLSAVISVSASGSADSQMKHLHKCLMDFNRENVTDFLLQKSPHGFDIYTNLNTVRRITNGFSACRLRHYLCEHLDTGICIGYGIGNSVSEAMENAQDAGHEARSGGSSYIITESGERIGPLDSQHILTLPGDPSPEQQEAAHRCGLSPITIQKLCSVLQIMQTNIITSRELASKLDVTVVNANRVLNSLVEGGYAETTFNKSTISRGRPSKVYRINLPGVPKGNE